eukprot:TRINITY_DN4663_c0_g1_i7.p1 TRINITY_DN4663_c0_g1~~TRINITY_DN4663_c0_g1_i7.p1  ORF type:complete len:196 (+),score=42.91 TRINITY_DN4663_c0_g1_i7:64-588(+)
MCIRDRYMGLNIFEHPPQGAMKEKLVSLKFQVKLNWIITSDNKKTIIQITDLEATRMLIKSSKFSLNHDYKSDQKGLEPFCDHLMHYLNTILEQKGLPIPSIPGTRKKISILPKGVLFSYSLDSEKPHIQEGLNSVVEQALEAKPTQQPTKIFKSAPATTSWFGRLGKIAKLLT